jgi:hypothetical protein
VIVRRDEDRLMDGESHAPRSRRIADVVRSFKTRSPTFQRCVSLSFSPSKNIADYSRIYQRVRTVPDLFTALPHHYQAS